MLYRIQKFLVSTTHVALFVLLLHAVFGAFPVPRALSFAVLSLVWLKVTIFHERSLLASFEDRMLRRLIFVPLALGTLLSASSLTLALLPGLPTDPVILLTAIGALVELVGWFLVFKSYRERRADYNAVGSGFLSKSTWMNPPLEVIPDGALILTDGRMARRARNSVGHSELVVKDKQGKLRVASSYIETGVCMHTLRALIATQRKSKENYIVLVLRQPLTVEQSARAFEGAEAIKVANEIWRDKENVRRNWLFNFLPMPSRWRTWLLKYGMSTGYDGVGKYWGGTRKDRYTCMAANLLVLRSVGVPVGEYGTGAFGLVGEVNPMVPVRLMQDPAYRVLTTADQAALTKSQAESAKPVVA